MYYLNQNVKNLNRIFDQNKREGYLRLDLNENPGGLPQKFINKVLEGVTSEFVSQYPETLAFTEKLARYLNTDIEHLCLVNGSAEGIRYVIEAFTSFGGKIVGVTPTYAMYEIYANMYGREFVPVRYAEDLRMPIENILSKLSKDVQLLILVNPNNPIGNTYSESDFLLLLETAQKYEITILIDEAYHYFYPKSFIRYAFDQNHIFVTRTFSKLFSMAGARLGYVVGWPDGIRMVQKMCTPHNINAFAELLAGSILDEPGMIDELILKHKKGRIYLEEALKANGYIYQGEAGNFIFIKSKTAAECVVKRMKEEKGILIKTYNDINKLGTCLRVTTGEKKYMERFMEALIEVDRCK